MLPTHPDHPDFDDAGPHWRCEKYRKEADGAIGAIQTKQKEEQPKDYEDAGKDEVRYAKAMWDENYTSAYETARGIADHLTSAELAGYRAWWWYLASVAASFMQDESAEQDCLERASKCGVNSGWLNRLRLQRNKAAKPEISKGTEPNAEGLWDLLSNWGWAGPAFEQQLAKMIDQLKDNYHVGYHEGLEALGKCFGATTTRSTESGAPDVVWSFTTDLHLAFEAKTEKKKASVLSKKDVQEAKGHADWIRTHLSDNAETTEIATVVVAPFSVASPDRFAVRGWIVLCRSPISVEDCRQGSRTSSQVADQVQRT